MRLELGYPDAQAERALLNGTDRRALLASLEPHIGPEDLLQLQREVQQVHVSPALLDYLQALLNHTRQDSSFAHGLSPRAGLALLHGARAWAYMDGRKSVIPEDLQAVLPAVVAHRLSAAKGDGGTATGARLAEHLVQQVAIP
jgi:MoxR-like ATPase